MTTYTIALVFSLAFMTMPAGLAALICAMPEEFFDASRCAKRESAYNSQHARCRAV